MTVNDRLKDPTFGAELEPLGKAAVFKGWRAGLFKAKIQGVGMLRIPMANKPEASVREKRTALKLIASIEEEFGVGPGSSIQPQSE